MGGYSEGVLSEEERHLNGGAVPFPTIRDQALHSHPQLIAILPKGESFIVRVDLS